MEKPKETKDQRLDRVRLGKTMKTTVFTDKKNKYNRKRAKSTKDWPAFLLERGMRWQTLLSMT